jgi:hypothetical protein
MSFNQTAKQVAAKITKIDAKKLRADVQGAVVGVIGHAMAHGSSPLVDVLMARMDGVPMLKRLAPLVAKFLLKHGPFVHAKDTGWQFSKAKRAAIEEAGYDFAAFESECPMWDDASDDAKKSATFDLMKELERVIAKGAKKSTEGECVTAELLPYLVACKAKFVSDAALTKAKAEAEAEAESIETARKFAAEILAAEQGEPVSA